MSTPFKDRKPLTDSEIREYFKILKNDPKSRVFAPLAEGLIRRGRLEESENLCIHGVGENPHFSDGHLAYARVLFFLFRYKDALNEVKKTLALDSANVDAYLIAAEIFLSRSQVKAASDACMKVLDLDPTNSQALQILKKINDGSDDPAVQDGRFSTISGTAPSRKSLKSDKAPAMTNPFEQLMSELQQEGARLLEDEQPFTALSAGSQAGIPMFDEDDNEESEEFTQPTQPIDLNSIPKLPAHPPTPNPTGSPVNEPKGPIHSVSAAKVKRDLSKPGVAGDILSQVPKKSPNQQEPIQDKAPSTNAADNEGYFSPQTPLQKQGQDQSLSFSQNQITSWQRIDAAQSIIDSYKDRIAPPMDGPPPKISRWKSLLSSLGFIAVISAVLIIIIYLSTDTKKTLVAVRRSYKPPAGSPHKNDIKHELMKTKDTQDSGSKNNNSVNTANTIIPVVTNPPREENGFSETKKITELKPKKKKHPRKKNSKRRKRRRVRRKKTRHKTRRGKK